LDSDLELRWEVGAKNKNFKVVDLLMEFGVLYMDQVIKDLSIEWDYKKA